MNRLQPTCHNIAVFASVLNFLNIPYIKKLFFLKYQIYIMKTNTNYYQNETIMIF